MANSKKDVKKAEEKKEVKRVKEKKEIKEQVVDLTEIKKELDLYIDKSVRESIDKELDKTYRKIIRRKNINIIFKNIVIIILLIVIGYLLFLLYKNNLLNTNVLNNNAKEKQVIEVIEKDNKEETKENILTSLVDEYGYLIDDYNINEDSEYIESFYKGNLPSELRNYISLSQISFDETTDGDYDIIDSENIKEIHNKLFDEKYSDKDFVFNGNKLRFIEQMKSYITDSKLKKFSSKIKKEILDVQVKDDEVYITTVEGLIEDNKICNIVTKDVIDEYKDNLSKYKDKLNVLTYVFKDERLVKIEKE